MAYSNYVDVYSFALASGTENPQGTINMFVDLLFGSKTGYMDYNFGQHYVAHSDNVYEISYKVPETKTYYTSPSLGGYPEFTLGDSFSITYDYKSYLKTTINSQKDRESYIKNYTEPYLKAGKLVEIPIFRNPSGQTYEQMRSLLSMENQNLIEAIQNPNTNMEQALKSYRQAVLGYGLADVLKESNMALGLPND